MFSPATLPIVLALTRDADVARIFEQGLATVVGYALPIVPADGRPGVARWRSGPWFFRPERMYLLPGDSPMGYRLPLDSIPWAAPGDRQRIVTPDPTQRFAPLPSFRKLQARETIKQTPNGDRRAAPFESASWIARTAMCAEPRNGVLYIFMPPAESLEESTEATYLPEEDYTCQKLRVEPLKQIQLDELRMRNYWTASGSFLWRLIDLMPIRNNAIYGGFALQAGRISTRVVDPHAGIARLDANGQVDERFVLDSGWIMALQDDGAVVLGGGFTQIDGQSRFGLARFVVPRRLLDAPTLTAEGTFSMTLTGQIGRAYRVEASTDLVNWGLLTNITAGVSAASLMDPDAAGLRQRFYRTVSP
jgi:hypothetical protein